MSVYEAADTIYPVGAICDRPPCKLGFIGMFITRFVGEDIILPSYKLGFIGEICLSVKKRIFCNR